MSTTATIDRTQASEIAIVGGEIDDDGEINLLIRKTRRPIDQQQMDRFHWFCILQEAGLADLLGTYGSLIVRWEPADDYATVHLIPCT